MDFLVIGKDNCNACKMVQKIFNNKQIQYTYIKLEDLTEEQQSKYIQMAKEQGKLSMPLIIKNDTLCTLQEVI